MKQILSGRMDLKFGKRSTKPFLKLIFKKKRKKETLFGYFLEARRATWVERTTAVDKLAYNQCSKNIICWNRRKQDLYKEGFNR